MKLMARDLSSCEITRATMSVAEEGATPSPRPTAALDRNKPASNQAANGKTSVAVSRNACNDGWRVFAVHGPAQKV